MSTTQNPTDFLTPAQIEKWPVAAMPRTKRDLKKPLREAIAAGGLDHPLQVAGHHFAIGCVALEITQRCNLDCAACYLSDRSEAVHDLPLSEAIRRIDLIAEHYGPNANVQITGGDPTLRERTELVAIVSHLKKRNLRPALFTNGIKASRSLLRELKGAGLKDVAFHVDMTQGRKGFDSEEALNGLRDEYISRARGLGLQIIFNTTIFDGNLGEIAMLSRFFAARAKDIHLASFQMIANTGRGTERNRPEPITQERVMRLVSEGAGAKLAFDFPKVGHPDCNRYAKCLVAGDARVSVFDERDRPFFEKLLLFTRGLFLDRHAPAKSALRLAARLIGRDPSLLFSGLGYLGRKTLALRRGLIAGARPHLITFYIHNFMHAHALERERCKACVFMAITRDGPVSMCVHNAKRDSYILQPVRQSDGTLWHPLGRDLADAADTEHLPLKKLKGRARAARLDAANPLPAIEGRIGIIATRRRLGA